MENKSFIFVTFNALVNENSHWYHAHPMALPCTRVYVICYILGGKHTISCSSNASQNHSRITCGLMHALFHFLVAVPAPRESHYHTQRDDFCSGSSSFRMDIKVSCYCTSYITRKHAVSVLLVYIISLHYNNIRATLRHATAVTLCHATAVTLCHATAVTMRHATSVTLSFSSHKHTKDMISIYTYTTDGWRLPRLWNNLPVDTKTQETQFLYTHTH